MFRSRLVLLSLLICGFSITAAAQGRVEGRVLDAETGEPLPAVQVVITEENLGDITDSDGRYAIPRIPAGTYTLEARFVGYETGSQEITVTNDGTTQGNFSLSVSALELDEVVVTGVAGQARRREIGNSVAQIDLAEIKEPVGNLDNLLSGRVAGLNVQLTGGPAGSGAIIRLRGNNSVAMSNSPLIYIDGVRVRSDSYPKNVPPVGFSGRSSNSNVSPLNDINPEDIARVEVIKGAAATTLYGTEAAAGVIQIFTKRGQAGTPQWSFQVDQGFDRMLKFGTDALPFFGMEEFIDIGHRQRYTASVAGGGRDLRYFVSGGYTDNTGVEPDSYENRLNFKGNFGFSPMENLQINATTTLANTSVQNPPQGNNAHGLTLNAFRGRASYFGYEHDHPEFVSSLEQLLEYEITSDINRFVLGSEVLYQMTPNFTHKFTVGFDRAGVENRNYRPFGFVRAQQGILSNESWTGQTLTLEYMANYNLRLNEDFRTNLSVGGQKVEDRFLSILAYGEDLPPGEATVSGAAQQLAREDEEKVINAGVFGQALFDLKNKYFVTVGLRLDGNSAFGEDFGLQAYPKVSGSYVISDERFWPENLGQLKLRAAWGQAGRAPGAFDAVRTWDPVGWGGVVAFEPENVGNPDLGPERTTEIELGFEGGFLNERLSVDFSWYNARTEDALFDVTQLPSNGFGGAALASGAQLENVGEITNKGIELALNGDIVRKRDFELSAGFTVSTNYSNVEDLGGAAAFEILNGGWIEEDGAVPAVTGRMILNPDAMAEPEFALDENGNVDSRAVFGPNLPTHVLGGNLALTFPYGISLFARGEFMGGHYIEDGASNNVARRGAYAVCDEIVIGGLNAYELIENGQRDGLTARQRAMCDADLVSGAGNLFIYPADFFKLRELTLSLPIPLEINGVSSATFRASGRNIFRWLNDDFPVFDPEMAGRQGRGTSAELDATRFISEHIPAPSTWTFSLRFVLN